MFSSPNRGGLPSFGGSDSLTSSLIPLNWARIGTALLSGTSSPLRRGRKHPDSHCRLLANCGFLNQVERPFPLWTIATSVKFFCYKLNSNTTLLKISMGSEVLFNKFFCLTIGFVPFRKTSVFVSTIIIAPSFDTIWNDAFISLRAISAFFRVFRDLPHLTALWLCILTVSASPIFLPVIQASYGERFINSRSRSSATFKSGRIVVDQRLPFMFQKTMFGHFHLED